MRTAAYVRAIDKVATATRLRGIYPWSENNLKALFRAFFNFFIYDKIDCQ
jgi:hypothetical protein